MEDIPDNPLARIAVDCVNRLIHEDSDLLLAGVHEQAVSHRLAAYLQNDIPDLRVDTEYNRHGINVKSAILPSGKKNVVPDIVVHSRGDDNSNRLVIELKIVGRGDDEDRDHAHQKLVALVHGDRFRYELGLYLELGVVAGAVVVANATWYFVNPELRQG